MTVFIVGRRSYLGGVLLQHMAPRYPAQAIGLAELGEMPVHADDVIVNCAFSPDWYHRDAPQGLGLDGIAAAVAQRASARYVMMSSRMVYEARLEPPLAEDDPVAPTSAYGRNKARIEAGLRQFLGERLLILRIANVFGSEPIGRPTFMSTALASLVQRGEIELDIDPDTRKDFVPSSFVAQATTTLIDRSARGIVNVGSGIALRIGDVASALIRGYGRGEIRVTGTALGEQFRLDVARLHTLTGLSLTAEQLLHTIATAAQAHRNT